MTSGWWLERQQQVHSTRAAMSRAAVAQDDTHFSGERDPFDYAQGKLFDSGGKGGRLRSG